MYRQMLITFFPGYLVSDLFSKGSDITVSFINNVNKTSEGCGGGFTYLTLAGAGPTVTGPFPRIRVLQIKVMCSLPCGGPPGGDPTTITVAYIFTA